MLVIELEPAKYLQNKHLFPVLSLSGPLFSFWFLFSFRVLQYCTFPPAGLSCHVAQNCEVAASLVLLYSFLGFFLSLRLSLTPCCISCLCIYRGSLCAAFIIKVILSPQALKMPCYQSQSTSCLNTSLIILLFIFFSFYSLMGENIHFSEEILHCSRM